MEREDMIEILEYRIKALEEKYKPDDLESIAKAIEVLEMLKSKEQAKKGVILDGSLSVKELLGRIS